MITDGDDSVLESEQILVPECRGVNTKLTVWTDVRDVGVQARTKNGKSEDLMERQTRKEKREGDEY